MHGSKFTPPRELIARALLAMAISSTLCSTSRAGEQDTSATHKAKLLLAKMTQDEKISLVHGVGFFTSPIGGGGFVPGIERMGIPPTNYADSSSGINLAGKNTTALPATLALAASWDRPWHTAMAHLSVAQRQAYRSPRVIRVTFLLMPVGFTSQRSVQVLGFDDYGRLAPLRRLIRFLFVRPAFCLGLPSDS